MAFPQLYTTTGEEQRHKFVSGREAMTPKGVTVHYTADRIVERVIRSLAEKNLGYHIFIDRNGVITQSALFDRSLNHAGDALWNGQSPNRSHIAVSLVTWGELKYEKGVGFKAWNGKPIIQDEVRSRPSGGMFTKARYWDRCTPAQEQSLKVFLLFCMVNGISADDVCGHDECAIPKGRKSDPGGVLSMTMGELRETLKRSQSVG